MIREQVFAIKMHITKSKQVYVFQVKLPQNCGRIVGVEYGHRQLKVTEIPTPPIEPPLPDPPLPPSEPPKEPPKEGEDRTEVTPPPTTDSTAPPTETPSDELMKNFQRNELFGELRLQSCDEADIFYTADIKASENNIGEKDFSLNAFWKAFAYTHQTQCFEDEISLNGKNPVITGVYKDKSSGQNPDYIVNVYLWIERKAAQD
ncbi:MAG: hypothetical protein KF900_09415 [Bacteroidetes bacterium]|nr:hypothetical protein [Bacteroidota bacterium]